MANGKREEKGKKPDFVIRARQGPNSDFYITLGACWKVDVNGEECLSVKMNAIPIGWDGSALILPPKED